MVAAYCHFCGLVFPSMYSGARSMKTQGNIEPCPRCGQPAETQNADVEHGFIRQMPGNSPMAEMAFSEFQERAVKALKAVKISRQQARRFERTVEKKSTDAVKRVADEIAPEVSAAVNDALATDKPGVALRWLSKLLGVIAVAGTGLFATAAGLNESIDLIERLNGGKPIHELIEELQKEGQEDKRPDKPKKKTDSGNDEQPNPELPKTTEI